MDSKIWLKSNKKTAGVLAAAVFLLLLDRLLKALALANFKAEILGELLRFDFMPNYGIAFSIPFGGLTLNLLIGALVAGLAYWAAKSFNEAKMSQFAAIIAIVAGAASNLFDRLRYGYVVDYLDLQYFTIFNLADVLICLGVGWLIWLNWTKK